MPDDAGQVRLDPPSPGPSTWSRRQVAAVAAAVLAVAAALVALSLHGLERLDEELDPDLVVDQAALTLVRRQLEPVAADIDELPSVAVAVPDGPVQFAGCSTDSGGVLQPKLERSWTLVGAARSDDALVASKAGGAVAIAFAGQLTAAGWDASGGLGRARSTSCASPTPAPSPRRPSRCTATSSTCPRARRWRSAPRRADRSTPREHLPVAAPCVVAALLLVLLEGLHAPGGARLVAFGEAAAGKAAQQGDIGVAREHLLGVHRHDQARVVGGAALELPLTVVIVHNHAQRLRAVQHQQRRVTAGIVSHDLPLLLVRAQPLRRSRRPEG